jgi:hypothetical protein
MAIATVKQLCTPNTVVTSDSLAEQVAQLDEFATGKIEGQEFLRRNYFTAGLELLVNRGFERLAGRRQTSTRCGGWRHRRVQSGFNGAAAGNIYRL